MTLTIYIPQSMEKHKDEHAIVDDRLSMVSELVDKVGATQFGWWTPPFNGVWHCDMEL